MIRIVVIEDEPLIRLGVKTAISEDPEIELCGEADSGERGVQLVEEKQPDVVLLDIGLPDVSGLDVIPVIKEKFPVKVIVFTCESSEYTVSASFKYGADSYLLKQDVEVIKYAIHKTYEGQSWIDPNISKFFLGQSKKTLKKGKLYKEKLSPTEIEILKLINQGLSNKEIANKLFVTENTVKTHISNLFSKLMANNRVQAVNNGFQLGYLQKQRSFHQNQDQVI